MKRSIALVLLFTFILTLVSCGGIDNERADKLAMGFVEDLLVRDEEGMADYLHPDAKGTAMPDDDFYKDLEENHFFILGNSITAMDSIEKSHIENTSLDGTVLQCKYVVRSNELFYDVELLILENDNGYGIVAVSMRLNTNPTYYAGSEKK